MFCVVWFAGREAIPVTRFLGVEEKGGEILVLRMEFLLVQLVSVLRCNCFQMVPGRMRGNACCKIEVENIPQMKVVVSYSISVVTSDKEEEQKRQENKLI